MGYRRQDDFTSDMLSGQSFAWVQAFVDTVKAKLAASGLASWWLHYGYHPVKNYTDFMRATPFTSGGFAPTSGTNGALSWSTDIVLSDEKSLMFNPSASGDSTKGFGPVFRVTAGRPYRIRTTAYQAVLPNGVFVHGIRWLDKDGVEISTSAPTFVFAAATTWTVRTAILTAPANASFGMTVLGLTLATNKLYVDEVTVEAMQPAFHAIVTANYAWTVTHLLQADLVLYDHWGCYDSGAYTFTAPFQGRYRFSGGFRTASIAGEFYELYLSVNAASKVALGRTSNDGGAAALYGTTELELAAGDVVALNVLSSAGGAKTMSGGTPPEYSWFAGSLCSSQS